MKKRKKPGESMGWFEGRFQRPDHPRWSDQWKGELGWVSARVRLFHSGVRNGYYVVDDKGIHHSVFQVQFIRNISVRESSWKNAIAKKVIRELC